jgi:hypothetical protein
MRLDAALKRVGVTIRSTEKKPDGGVVLLLRVDPSKASLWADTVNEFLLASANEEAWRTDVSKRFFPAQGVVKFFWRVVLSGDVSLAGQALGLAATRAVQQGVEVTSMPLIGRKEYPFDPSRGKLKGAHDAATAQSAVAVAVRGGNT